MSSLKTYQFTRTIIFLFLLSGATHNILSASIEKEAALRLKQAIIEYRKGFFRKSTFFLEEARILDFNWVELQADAQKLQAFLELSQHKRNEAAKSMVKSILIKPDPFLYYLLGQYNLDLGFLRESFTSYKKAIQIMQKQGVDIESPVFEYALPFACPDSTKIGSINESQLWPTKLLRNPYAYFARANDLWQRSLHPFETASAVLQSLILSKRLKQKNTTGQKRLKNYLSLLQSRGFLNYTPSVGTKRLLGNPENDSNFRFCLNQMIIHIDHEKENIRLGQTDPALKRLKIIHKYLEIMHINRINMLGNINGYFSYGSYQLANNRIIKSLHFFRKALALTAINIKPGKVGGKIRIGSQIYRHLSYVYRRMNRDRDHLITNGIANNLENYLNNSLDFSIFRNRKLSATKNAANYLIQKLLLLGGTYPANREILLLLISHAKNSGNIKRHTYLMQKLKERDAKYDDQELLSAFHNL